MKVLFVTRGWPTKKDPMSGNYEAVQAKALARKGVEVTVLYYDEYSIFKYFGKKKQEIFIEDGVTVIKLNIFLLVIPFLLNNFKLNCYFIQLSLKYFYRYYLRKNSPFDVIHAHSAFRAYALPPLVRMCNVPFVITEHWSKMNTDQIDEERREMAKAYPFADAIITVSKGLADSLKKKFGIDSIVIHNMVPNSFFDGKIDTSNDDEIIDFISVGALLPRKKFDILIKALANAKNIQKCRLRIVGDGPEKQSLERCIVDNHVSDRVKMLGLKTPEEVGKLLEEANCFILTSENETFGIVYIEGMAKGLPVIATKCGGPESFVNESNGILVKVDDVEETAHAIDYMVEHINDYDREKIRQYCYENFSQDQISEQIIKVYDKVLEKRKLEK
jgi:glycosyltransferase involved in cell wall biosynthesis